MKFYLNGAMRKSVRKSIFVVKVLAKKAFVMEAFVKMLVKVFFVKVIVKSMINIIYIKIQVTIYIYIHNVYMYTRDRFRPAGGGPYKK